MTQAVAQAEIEAVLDVGAPVTHDAPRVAVGAGGEFVMNRRARQLHDAPAVVVDARQQIALVEEIFVFLVEPANRQQHVAPE